MSAAWVGDFGEVGSGMGGPEGAGGACVSSSSDSSPVSTGGGPGRAVDKRQLHEQARPGVIATHLRVLAEENAAVP